MIDKHLRFNLIQTFYTRLLLVLIGHQTRNNYAFFPLSQSETHFRLIALL